MRRAVKVLANFLGADKELTGERPDLTDPIVLIFDDLVDDYVERAGITDAELREAKRHAARGLRQ